MANPNNRNMETDQKNNDQMNNKDDRVNIKRQGEQDQRSNNNNL
ncbi:MAG: hypothetical protein V4691_11005 [Pseudomonadota bacterium]